MGEIRLVGPDKTRGYHYPVCKKIKSYIPVSKPKGKKAHTRIDKRSKKRMHGKLNEQLFSKQVAVQVPSLKIAANLFVSIFCFI